MRYGQLKYNERSGEFDVPRPRRRRSWQMLRLRWQHLLIPLVWLVIPWLWWWKHVRLAWERRQFWRLVLLSVAALVLVRIYRYAVVFTLENADKIYVGIVYSIRFVWAICRWLWDFLLECIRITWLLVCAVMHWAWVHCVEYF